MHYILWASILASAGVALATTLLVEYLAKPGLEARKDRILEDRREQRTAVKDIKRAARLGDLLYVYCSEGKPQGTGNRKKKLAGMLRAEVNKIAAEIADLVRSVHEVIEVPEWMGDEWTDATSHTMGYSIRISAGDNLSDDELADFEDAVRSLWLFAGWFQLSKWYRRWGKHKLMEVMRSEFYHTIEERASEDNASLSSSQVEGTTELCP
jgi:hypothetical protein